MDDYNDVIIKLYKPGRHNDEVLKATQIAEIFDTVVPNFLEKLKRDAVRESFLSEKHLHVLIFISEVCIQIMLLTTILHSPKTNGHKF